MGERAAVGPLRTQPRSISERAVSVGLEKAVQEMLRLMKNYHG
jgi:pyridoxine 5'-phosphate synthase PdxJ